ncbi:MAG: monofunctional biosynthetic peptidoglycan transglycosylase [Candidatus Stahlbacteria bacterium]|nr:monofunctional biosynthetic peptidoglycan transglycosylase [Candidatus Stahlbacteria bacterium]
MKWLKLNLWKIPLFIIGFSLFEVLLFRFLPPVITPHMLIRWVEGKVEHKPAGISVKWCRIEKVSPYLIQAIIASEDQRFFTHNGFDWEQIDRQLNRFRRLKGLNKLSKLKGASTISMQTARSTFLWQGRRGSTSSWIRKGLEAYYTILIELLWPKKRILEVYLNVIEWGSGIYGAEAAARKYFKCSAHGLTSQQAALMVAVLPNPRRWSPASPSPYILKRQLEILQQTK